MSNKAIDVRAQQSWPLWLQLTKEEYDYFSFKKIPYMQKNEKKDRVGAQSVVFAQQA